MKSDTFRDRQNELWTNQFCANYTSNSVKAFKQTPEKRLYRDRCLYTLVDASSTSHKQNVNKF